jgi:predicted dehydrogenase
MSSLPSASQTSAVYRVAIVGVGRGGEGVGAHSIGYWHAETYTKHPRTEIVGACDLNVDNLARFAERFGVKHTSTDLSAMLAAARPDIVSVCTYAQTRRAAVEACVAAGVKAIWAEKPFALAMDDARSMVELTDRAGVKLIVNYCRRPLHLFREVRRLLDAGAIGKPMLVLAAIDDWDQAEWGSHWHDMIRFWLHDQPVKWVFGQVRCTGAKQRYGRVMEEHSVAYYSFTDGTRTLLDGGVAFNTPTALRIVGAAGFIDVGWNDKVTLLNADGLHEIPVNSTLHVPKEGEPDHWQAILSDLLAWIEGGPAPELAGANAIKSTELYLAAWESARRSDRIDLPLTGQSEFPLQAIAARSHPA